MAISSNYPFNENFNPFGYSAGQMSRGKIPTYGSAQWQDYINLLKENPTARATVNAPSLPPGAGATVDAPPGTGTTVNAPPGADETSTFMLPEDKYPYSGLPESYRDQLLSFVMPRLQTSVTNMPQNIDNFTNQALGTYRQELQNALKEMIPNVINNLAKRGILSSSVAENTLAQTASKAATQSATKGYETAMQAALMKNNIPNTLAGLLQYGQYSQDPSVMYRTMANILASL